MPKHRYADFVDQIDIDAFEEAIDFSVMSHDRGNDQGYCIFPENHKSGDSTGKFAIHREKRLWNCFVCGGGDLLSLAMMARDLDYEEATDWLYQFAHGDGRSDEQFEDHLLELLADVEMRTERMPYFNARVLERFDGPLWPFAERGISEEVCAMKGLRFHEGVRKAAPIKQTADGAIKISDDYTGPATIWPHYWQGRLVGWQCRWLDWTKDRDDVPVWLPKWTNTTDFPKSTTLYNYDFALHAQDPIVVCESLGTVEFLASFDIPAVAWFGSKPTDAQFRLLRRFQQGVILAPDNDSNKAGDKILRAINYLNRFIPVMVTDKVTPEDVGADPDADGLDLGDYNNTSDPEAYVRLHLENRTVIADGLYI